MRYRKKPVEVEAIQYTESNWVEVISFTGGDPGSNANNQHAFIDRGGNFVIRTLEGEMRASVGDWIIKGVKGEFYPCKPDIFEATYEEVPDG